MHLGCVAQQACIFRPLRCRTMLRKVSDSANIMPLNPPEVAHNLTKAVNQRPDYRGNFVYRGVVQYCWDWNTGVYVFQGFCKDKCIQNQTKCLQYCRWSLFWGVHREGFHCICEGIH